MPNAPSEEPNAALAVLGYHAGPRAGEEIALRSPVLTVGQGGHNDVVLADDSISTTHARLEFDTGAWRITDLGSTNGTYVEGVRLAPNVPTPLASGSVVRFGALSLRFDPVAEADAAAARAGYSAPVAPLPLAERRPGFRLPVWVLLLILLLLAALAFLLLQTPAAAAMEGGDSPHALALALAPPGIP